MSIEQITLTNVGPIEHISIPFPSAGKIVVLRGRNGAGKSTALEHVENAISGNGKGNVRDGAASGSVEACGITLKLGRSTRRSGELAVEALEGKFNISDLIDPGFIDAKAADARRIKAFAQIQKVLPSADLFYDLAGGRERLEKVCRPASLQSDDLVQMAERIKADLQDAAKREEDQAVHAEGRATGAKAAANGVDLTAECDAAKLAADLNAAIREEARLKADAEAAAKSQRATQLARDQLADAEAEYSGPSLADAIAAEEKAKAAQVTAEGPAKELAADLQQAKHKAELAEQKRLATKKQATEDQQRFESLQISVREAEHKVESLEQQLALARQDLAKLEAQRSDLQTAAALSREDLTDATKEATDAAEDCKEIESLLQSHNQANELACQAVAAAVAARKTAEAHEAAMKKWREQLNTVQVAAPTDEELAAAAQRVAACNAACEQGALIRKAREQVAEAEKHIKVASGHRKAAQELRDAAKGTDDVLSNIVQQSGSQLRVEAGRLVLDTPRRGKTFFHELSAGERAKIAIDIGIDAMPKTNKPGVIVISQEIFEGLDPVNRDALAAHIAERGVGILTAEAGEQEEITPEVYEPATAGVA